MCGWIGISLNIEKCGIIVSFLTSCSFCFKKMQKKLESNEEISGSESNKKKFQDQIGIEQKRFKF